MLGTIAGSSTSRISRDREHACRTPPSGQRLQTISGAIGGGVKLFCIDSSVANAGANPYASLLLPGGKLYGATPDGGLVDNLGKSVIFRIVSLGHFRDLDREPGYTTSYADRVGSRIRLHSAWGSGG